MNTHDEPRKASLEPNAPRKPARRRWLGYTLVGAAAILGVTSVTAVATGGPDGWCPGGYERMHWGGGKPRGGFEPGMMREFAGRKVDRLLYEVDATPEQREQVKGILRKAFEEMGDRRDQRRQSRQAIVEILTAPEIDRAKLQALRAERLEQMEQASERIMEAFADAAEVLTSEQRAKLGDVIDQRGFGPGRHRH